MFKGEQNFFDCFLKNTLDARMHDQIRKLYYFLIKGKTF